jgi:acyl-CoA thioesterase
MPDYDPGSPSPERTHPAKTAEMSSELPFQAIESPYLIADPSRALCQAIGLLGLIGHDAAARSVKLRYDVRPEFCHSNGTMAQGGFITAWLDHAMASAVVLDSEGESNVSSLEIKVSFLEAVRPGVVIAEGRVLRRGKRVAFLEARLFDQTERLLATASSSGMLVPYKP